MARRKPKKKLSIPNNIMNIDVVAVKQSSEAIHGQCESLQLWDPLPPTPAAASITGTSLYL